MHSKWIELFHKIGSNEQKQKQNKKKNTRTKNMSMMKIRMQLKKSDKIVPERFCR